MGSGEREVCGGVGHTKMTVPSGSAVAAQKDSDSPSNATSNRTRSSVPFSHCSKRICIQCSRDQGGGAGGVCRRCVLRVELTVSFASRAEPVESRASGGPSQYMSPKHSTAAMATNVRPARETKPIGGSGVSAGITGSGNPGPGDGAGDGLPGSCSDWSSSSEIAPTSPAPATSARRTSSNSDPLLLCRCEPRAEGVDGSSSILTHGDGPQRPRGVEAAVEEAVAAGPVDNADQAVECDDRALWRKEPLSRKEPPGQGRSC